MRGWRRKRGCEWTSVRMRSVEPPVEYSNLEPAVEMNGTARLTVPRPIRGCADAHYRGVGAADVPGGTSCGWLA